MLIPGLHHSFGAPSDVKCQRSNTLNKPVLDQRTFQQLLAAAYTLQEHNDHLLVKESKVDSPQTFSDGTIAERVGLIPLVSLASEPLAKIELALEPVPPIAQSDVEPLAPLNDSALQLETDARIPALAPEVLEAPSFKWLPSKTAHLILSFKHAVPSATSSSGDRVLRKQFSQRNELFWKVATGVAMAAVSALLVGGTLHRLSPLPAGLALPSEVFQQPVPFRRAKRIVTVPARSSRVGTKTIVMETPLTKSEPTGRTVVAGKPPTRSATPTSAQKTIANSNRHSNHEIEADIVAPNTLVRYGTRSASPRAQLQIPIGDVR